jgi:hypothetical protein
MHLNAKPKAMRPGLESSINAAYTPVELAGLVKGTRIESCKIESIAIGAIISGAK